MRKIEHLKVLKYKTIITGLILIVFGVFGLKIIPDLMTEIIMLKNPEIFDESFNPQPIKTYSMDDSHGQEYIEAVFSSEDQAIIDKREDVLGSVDWVKGVSSIIAIFMFFFFVSSFDKYKKLKKELKEESKYL